ncbi:MAG: DUF1289 domain-containing protein [Tistlia sp.]
MTAPDLPDQPDPAELDAAASGPSDETGTPSREQRRERRRRRRAARVFDSSVPSPCIPICQIEEASGLCIGCRRSLDEIRDWPILTAEEKRALLARLPARGS